MWRKFADLIEARGRQHGPGMFVMMEALIGVAKDARQIADQLDPPAPA